MRKVLSAGLALLLVVLLAACTPEEADHLKAVNDFRTANGVPTLQWEEGAYAKAHDWSQHMADANKLSHSVLSQGVPAGWRTIGENVAYNSTLQGAMTALQNSPAHRSNLLNPRFTKVAVGVVQARGYFWVTEVFIG
jgi:uncharacterized protein YkwD